MLRFLASMTQLNPKFERLLAQRPRPERPVTLVFCQSHTAPLKFTFVHLLRNEIPTYT
jgi:hypothetical protein